MCLSGLLGTCVHSESLYQINPVRHLSRFDLRTVRVDFVECLMRFLPTEAEVKLLRQYERDRKPLEALSDEDRFMMQFSRLERLSQRMTIMTFMGNFNDNVQMLTPVRQTYRLEGMQVYRQVWPIWLSRFLSATPRHDRSLSFYKVLSEAEEDPWGQFEVTCGYSAWFSVSVSVISQCHQYSCSAAVCFRRSSWLWETTWTAVREERCTDSSCRA